ncbi:MULTISPECIES: helix-turn-helix domain-containing protein [Enterococcus]|uniref:Helix-turn-helix transcriptional regulator n=1 Tax=Enterococcus xiangfangensis TaxID=1296537 RepID=A0ABU3F9I3_9ENTE|nr:MULTISPECIES: helix-turn-helix transcriptional regulator [Enterococcus]MDT2604249.1 helix-turn-helix transcriptional regulator [Enterococcus dongliensis]MDT2668145.1 helix-turn-helix transcriptional regulator [Enterococcus dongliensis]MDT2703670.1 helix-turn-helix transcriptional regulator [Enterococcus dongliensis]MDT2759308.1 helix-turn-helix transcriptional regulator [Enterococcus xiangfangensis]
MAKNELANRIINLRESKDWTQTELGKKIGLEKSAMNKIENGSRKVTTDELRQLAKVFDVSTDYLLGNTNKKHYYDLTKKDENSIQRQLEEMIGDLSQGGPLAFSKDESEIDQETRELLIASLENSLRIAKIEAKKKFTPKKYRDE